MGQQKEEVMARRKNRVKEYVWSARVFTLLIVFIIAYPTVVNPNAISPNVVAIIGVLLATIRVLYGIQDPRKDDDDDSDTKPTAKRTAKRVLQKGMDLVEGIPENQRDREAHPRRGGDSDASHRWSHPPDYAFG
jgi:hypothetical protein